ncbi:MAG TPA: CaiB/BaiF CoA-transferase family protein [Gaiellaceae bacterium]|nr:CaiB/BaiF CoA-transferase family protein [Gaiellaceae bacterium]
MAQLSGILVVDLTRYLPGPYASRELLRLGARVVKIEPPEGDPLETSTPGWYRALNDGKDVVAWDARSEPQPPVLAEADVVLEGFRPGVLERLGVALPESAILCSLTGYGASGPRASHAGHDLNYMGYAGVLADTAPALPPVQVADLCAGAQAAVIEILGALLERGRTGRGARIVVSMTAGLHRLAAHRLTGEPIPRLLTGGAACYRIYETADGRHLTVAALEPKFWQRLCELIGRPDLVGRAFEPELPELVRLFRTRTLEDWLRLLEGRDTCVGPVLTLEEAEQALRRDQAQPPAGVEHESERGEQQQDQDEPGDDGSAAHDGRSFEGGA